MTLHEAIVEILRDAGRFMTDAELASEINARGNYRKRDGSAMMSSQIRLRVAKYPALFVREGKGVGLPEWGGRAPAAPVQGPIGKGAPPLSSTGLSDRRRELLRILDAVELGARPTQVESVAGRIARLTHAGIIPRQLAPCMRAITEARNVVEYDDEKLPKAQMAAVEANWAAVKEWAIARGVRLPGWDA